MPRGRPTLELAFESDPSDGAYTPWTDVTMDVRTEGHHSRRGRTETTTRYDTGTYNATLRNESGNYSPSNSFGIYYPNLVPRRPLRFMGEYPWFSQYAQYIQGIFNSATITWTGTNATLAQVGSPNYLGMGAMRMTASSAADMSARSTAFNVTPGQIWATSARYWAATTGRGIRTDIQWRDSGNNVLSTTAGTSWTSTTGGGWVRAGCVGTAPGSSAFAYVVVNVIGPANAEVHYIDAVPVEQSVAGFEGQYPLYQGYVDSFQQRFDGFERLVVVTASDAFKFFGSIDLQINDWQDAVAGGATDIWRMDESYGDLVQDITTGEPSVNLLEINRPGVYKVDGTIKFNQPGYKTGDDGGIEVDMSDANDSGGWTAPLIAIRATTGVFSVGFAWKAYNELLLPPTIPYPELKFEITESSNHVFSIQLVFGSPTTQVKVRTKTPGNSSELVIDQAVSGLYTNAWHRLFVTRASNGTTLKLYIDNTLIATGTATAATNIQVFPAATSVLYYSSLNTPTGIRTFMDELETATAEYSASQINDREVLYNAARSQDRMAQLIGRSAFPTTFTDLDADSGSTYIQPLGSKGSSFNLLDYLQLIQDTEGGQFFISSSGDARLITKAFGEGSPYNTSQATFGIGGGEYPYEEAVPVDDDTMLWNQVEITTVGGGSVVSNDPTSITRYFLSEYPSGRGLLFNNDITAMTARANALVARYKDPKTRLNVMRVFPGEDPAIWKLIFTLDIWSRITVKVLNPGAPGTPQSYVAQIVGIDHDVTRGEWYTTYHLSVAEANF